MIRSLRFVVLGLPLLLLACSGRMITNPLDAGGRRDAGPDAGSVDADIDAGPAPVDAGPRPDAGVDGGPPPCACPAFPTSCTPPSLDTPVFTPEAGDMAGQLFDVIACAEDELTVAVYQGDWDCIVGAINTALERDADLQVTAIVDNQDCQPGGCFAEMLTPSDRVTVVRDTRVANLMHHKVVIADRSRAWVGSANFTERSFCRDANDSIVLEQAGIVARLQTELDRMAAGEFSPLDETVGMPTTEGPYTLYFSPVSPASEPGPWFAAMRQAIADATTSIVVMISAWTRAELANDLAAAADDGVDVRVLVSHLYADDMPAQVLVMEGVDTRRASVHSKVMVIDGQTVITGSANWSMNAWSNNENQLWIDDATTAAAYTARFEALFADAAPVTLDP